MAWMDVRTSNRADTGLVQRLINANSTRSSAPPPGRAKHDLPLERSRMAATASDPSACPAYLIVNHSSDLKSCDPLLASLARYVGPVVGHLDRGDPLDSGTQWSPRQAKGNPTDQ